jgi:putative transposase
VHDQIATAHRFRVLNIVDDATRERVAAVSDTSISGKRVVRERADLIVMHAATGMICSNSWN